MPQLRALPPLGACAAALLACGACALPYRQGADASGDEPVSRLEVLHPLLAERIRDLEARSPRLRAALDSVRAGGVPVLVGTPEELRETAPWLGWEMTSGRLAEFAAYVDTTSGAVNVSVIRVDLRRIAAYQARDIPPVSTWFSAPERQARFERAVDAILIHELWGHLVPLAQTWSLRSHCPDPIPGQRELESCVMQRENELRVELGLSPRVSYTLDASW